MTDSTMSPVYEAGDTLLLDAAGPRKTGRDYVFCTDTTGDVVDARVGRLLASTRTHWSCRQWNPQRIIRLDRAAWPHAILIAGAFRRGLPPRQLPIWRQLRSQNLTRWRTLTAGEPPTAIQDQIDSTNRKTALAVVSAARLTYGPREPENPS